jgi:hypothetical protein
MGLQSDLMELINKTCDKGEMFHASSFEMEGVSEKQVANTLCALAAKELIQRGPIKGNYYINGKAPAAINPAQAIYDLLDFMAKAEAPLRRAAKILEAVDNA